MKRRVFGLFAVSTAVLVATVAATASGGRGPVLVLHDAVQGTIRPATLTERTVVQGRTRSVTKRLPFISPSTLYSASDPTGGPMPRGALAATSPAQAAVSPVPGLSSTTLGCSGRTSAGSVRVNQDCGYRLQSEEGITYNPANPDNLLGGMNDERQGRNQCGIAFSLDDGRHWGDMLPPFQAWRNAPEQMGPSNTDPNTNTILGNPGTEGIYQRASDPAVGFDSQGRAYFSCVTFDSNTNASGLFAIASPTGA